jgi:hypothetical protein
VNSETTSTASSTYTSLNISPSGARKSSLSAPLKDTHIIDYDALVLEEKIGVGAYGQVRE